MSRISLLNIMAILTVYWWRCWSRSNRRIQSAYCGSAQQKKARLRWCCPIPLHGQLCTRQTRCTCSRTCPGRGTNMNLWIQLSFCYIASRGFSMYVLLYSKLRRIPVETGKTHRLGVRWYRMWPPRKGAASAQWEQKRKEWLWCTSLFSMKGVRRALLLTYILP